MAILQNIETKEVGVLKPHHIVGRNPYNSCTVVQEKDVSLFHATIYWEAGKWNLKDHSRNGTLVDGEYIRGKVIELSKGNVIQFGKSKDTSWKILSIGYPSSYIKSVHLPKRVVELHSCMVLPGEKNPEVSFFYTEGGKWRADSESWSAMLNNGNTIQIENEPWLFVENEVLNETVEYSSTPTTAFFHFQLSLDEEHISVKLKCEEVEYDLGQRAHNYLLLALARKKLEDFNQGIGTGEQGWISTDELLKDISREVCKEVDVYYLNLQIHRLRKQLSKSKPFGCRYSNIIERRNGEIRFTYPHFKITKDLETVGQIMSLNNSLKSLSFN